MNRTVLLFVALSLCFVSSANVDAQRRRPKQPSSVAAASAQPHGKATSRLLVSAAPVALGSVTHAPQISALKVLSAQSHDVRAVFEVTAYDEDGDLVDGEYVSVSWKLLCGGSFLLGSTSTKQYTKKDEKTFVITTSTSQNGSSAGGTCELEVTVRDKAGTKSNALKTNVDFK